MKFLRRSDDDKSAASDTAAQADAPEGPIDTDEAGGGVTLGKGRPTPKRREAQGRRGPVAPAPMTRAEAKARKKELRKSSPKLTREARKTLSAENRMKANERRARMMAGEQDFLLARDKGPVRAYVRDFVDSRRNLVGLFMPLALLLIFTLFLSPQLQAIVTLAMLVMMLFMVLEGVLLGRTLSNRIRQRWPESTDTGFRIGWYAFVRASQIRKLRVPKPRVKPGDAI